MPQHVERRSLNPRDICSPQNFGLFLEALPAITKGKIMKVERFPDAERGTSMYSVFFRLNSREGQLLTIQYVPLQILRSRSFRGGDFSDERHDGIFFDMHLCTIEPKNGDKNIALSVAFATRDIVERWWQHRNDSYLYINNVDNHFELRLGHEVFQDITLRHLFKLIEMFVREYQPLNNQCKSYLNNRVFTIKQPKK